MRHFFDGLPAAFVVSAFCSLVPVPVSAQAQGVQACNVPVNLARFDKPLTRTGQRLAAHLPVTIVAVGSSSTAGAFASSSAASYPSPLAAELRQHFPGATITVLHRRADGEAAAQMPARPHQVVGGNAH